MAGAGEPQHVLVWWLLECQPDLSIPIHSHLWSKYSKIPGLNLFLQESYCRSLCGFPNFYFHFRAGRQLQGGKGGRLQLKQSGVGIAVLDSPVG